MATTNIELDIENITGVSDADDQFIVSAQKFVVSSIPKNLLKFAQTASSASTDGGAISYTRNDSIIDVQRSGYSCKEIPFSESVWSTTTGSLKKATSSFPVYWHQNDGVKIAPATDGSNAGYIFYVSSSKIDDDSDLRNAVIFRAASSEFTKLAVSKVTDWSDLTLPVAPSTPDFGSDLSMSSTSPVSPPSPSFTYTNASASDIIKPLISISDMASMTESAPSYTQPVMSLGSTPTISDLSISASIPVSPSISDNSVSFSTSSPTFVKPTLTSQSAFNDYWTLGDFGDSDPGVLSISVVVPSVPSLTSVTFTSIDSSLDTVAPVYATATVSASSVYAGSAPTFTKPVVSPDFAKVNTHLDANEDTELAQIKIQEIGAQLNEYGTDIQNEQAEFSKENVLYQSAIQESMQEVQIKNQVNLAQAQSDLQSATSNKD